MTAEVVELVKNLLPQQSRLLTDYQTLLITVRITDKIIVLDSSKESPVMSTANGLKSNISGSGSSTSNTQNQ